MAKEIERKFLVQDDCYLAMASAAAEMCQGYLSCRPDATVRVRVAGDEAWLTVKSRNRGAERDEWEYPVPPEDARAMLGCCEGAPVCKTRYLVPFGGYVWEVDCFHGALSGLVTAEVEMPSPDDDPPLPPFVGREVTGDIRYYNSSLSKASAPPSD